MKKITVLFSLLMFVSVGVFAQAIIVDDTVYAHIGDTITVNVTKNDTLPEGYSFQIFLSNTAYSYTDSTLTYIIDYDRFYNQLDFVKMYYYYRIFDDQGNPVVENDALVFLNAQNENYCDTLNINNVKAAIYAKDNQFWHGETAFGSTQYPALYEFPKGGNVSSIFTSGLWVGGMDGSKNLHLSAERYRQVGYDFIPGPVCSDGNQLWADTANIWKWNRVWKLSAEEVAYHKLHYNDPGYTPIKNIAEWPANGNRSLHQPRFIAPFVDVNNDSIYEPMQGDYPLIRGDQCIFFVINDINNHTESSGEPLEIEIHGMAYAFNMPDNPAFENTIFVSYKLINRSQFTFDSTYIGLFTDIDIGDISDDYIESDVDRGLFFGYNGTEVDGSGGSGTYGENPPAQGVIILGGPYMDADNSDNPAGECDESITGVGFGDGTVDNERLGLDRFISFNNGGSSGAQTDPTIASEYYNLMKGIWKDGTAVEYGGGGHINTSSYGPACRFMFPGMSDSCFWGTDGEEPYGPVDWTEGSANIPPTDIRGVGVSGPFTLEPGAIHSIDIAYTGAFAQDEKTAVEMMKIYADTIRARYMQNSDYFGYQWLGTNEQKAEVKKLKVYPNPVNNTLWVAYNGKNSPVEIQIFDNLGRVVLNEKRTASGSFTIDMHALPQGIYFIRLRDNNEIYSAKILKR